eukprot:COSAG06_NODE_2574_length_6643_cov_4.825402_2_plen_227_part_00
MAGPHVRRKGLPRTHADPLGAAAAAAAAGRLAGPAAGVGGREYACSRADTSAALVSRLARCEDFPARPAELTHANVETRTALSNAPSSAFELRTVAARCSAWPPTSEATRSTLRRRCAGDAGGRRAARAAPCALKSTSALPLGCAQPESNMEVLQLQQPTESLLRCDMIGLIPRRGATSSCRPLPAGRRGAYTPGPPPFAAPPRARGRAPNAALRVREHQRIDCGR